MANSSNPSWKYDVFISFRGEDTRKNFTSHLYAALRQKGINAFKDDRQLERGKTISQELVKAIRASKILMIIFSRNYAFSRWCLEEAVEIAECAKGNGQMVVPVFYNVNPNEVRKQTGDFGKAFGEHQLRFRNNLLTVQRWRLALTQLGSLSGWDLQERTESELIEEIIKDVLGKLRKSSLMSGAAMDFVGMNSRLVEMSMYLDMGRLNDVLFIGISGMGGIGKTTIARVVYEELASQFEGSSFLANVREVKEKHGLVPLQQQLLSEILMDGNIAIWDAHCGTSEIVNRMCKKRVLLILDDVNQLEQLKLLAGRHDWFGSGSRIIITTRDEHLLKCHGVDKIYKVQGLSQDESIHLFCLRAFKSDYPADDYVELSNEFVNYCNGLPLALDVLGSFLFDKSVNEWTSALRRLKQIPNQEILEKLFISFDGLEEVEKKIFLDIACFFNGEDKDYVIKVLESRGFYPHVGIRDLINKSLITISKERIWMHDLLQEMGREIVRQESQEEPGKRSRLWLYEDVYHVLSNDTGTEQVEAIVLDSCEQEDEELSAKAFTKMKRLRFLKLRNLHLSEGLEYLSNKLRYLEWDRYPFKSFPSTFQPNELIELHMRCSNIKHMWKGIKPLKMLKVIDLSYSVNLIKTMDFKDVPNLEELNLEGCTRLLEVHQSIGVLRECIISLNLKDCKSLVSLPNGICDLKSLKYLNLHGCSKLEQLPERLGDMTCLEKLNVGEIAPRQLPSTKLWDFLLPWQKFPKRFLTQKDPNPMAMALPALFSLKSLRSLNLSYCNLTDGALPSDLSCFPLLKTFNLSGNNFVSIPSSISRLSKLEDFQFSNCKRLQSFPNLPSSILFLSMEGCSALETLLPKSNSSQFELFNICAEGCKRLQLLPDLSSSILKISVEGFSSKETSPNLFVTHSSKPSMLTFINILKSVEVQSENIPLVARMSGYLHYLLRHRHSSLGFFNPSTQVSVCLAGSEIPGWFNYQSPGSSLEMQLPPYWWTNKWMGFTFCIVFEFREPIADTSTIFCDLHARIAPDQDLFLGRSSVQISKELDTTLDQLWVNYIPRSCLTCLDKWEESDCLKMTFFSNELSFKYCGIRKMYSRDADELVLCSRPLESMGLLPSNANNVEKSKRSPEDYCCGSSGEPSNEISNMISGLPSKRLKVHVDPDVKLTSGSPQE
ncbi:disease resistance protein RUN1 isoform X1 [Ricinus communis]|uniref:disease resistance protein RUN1 isoform X1 n=2 Tax=Ricinus communis TaxID=3988 RepID=UPI00201A4E7D|nr:disease resistance protein RUN1 isoform X1 [Ricinus communis]